MLLDTSGKSVVDDLLKVIAEEVGDQFTTWGWNEFTPVGTSFFLDDFSSKLIFFQTELDDVTRRAFALALFDIATSLDCVDDGCVGARTAYTEIFELFHKATFSVAGWWTSKYLACAGFAERKCVSARKCW